MINLGVKVKVTQLYLTFCDPMDYTVRGILKARILDWVVFPFSRVSSQRRDATQVSCIVGDLGSNPGLGRTPWRRERLPLQDSGLENSTDCIDHGVAKKVTRLSHFHFLFIL